MKSLREKAKRLKKDEILELLYDFMWEKQLLLRKALVEINYFNYDDEEALSKRSKEELEFALGFLETAIIIGDESGLGAMHCPFCIIHQTDCNQCEYAKNHEKCYNKQSHFKDVINKRFLKNIIKALNEKASSFIRRRENYKKED